LNTLVVEFLTRKNCHLCLDSYPRVLKAARKSRLTVRAVDIDDDDLLVSRYGMRIPVLLGEGSTVIAEGELGSVTELTKELRSWRKAQVRRPRRFRLRA
jgi:hypothetical protein